MLSELGKCLVLLALLLIPAIGFGEDPRKDIPVFPGDFGIGQIADGEGWRTVFTLINLTNGPVSYTLYFIGDFGADLFLPIVGLGTVAAVQGTLALNGSTTIETAGTSPQVRQGWGFVLGANAQQVIGGMAVFRRSLPGIPDFEAVVPFGSIGALTTARQVMPFDHTSGFLTGVAIANGSPNAAIVVSATFREQNGAQFFVGTITLQPFAHTAFLLSDRFPQTANRKGVVEFTAPLSPPFGIVLLGLRFNPQGAFTTIFPMTSYLWF